MKHFLIIFLIVISGILMFLGVTFLINKEVNPIMAVLLASSGIIISILALWLLKNNPIHIQNNKRVVLQKFCLVAFIFLAIGTIISLFIEPATSTMDILMTILGIIIYLSMAIVFYFEIKKNNHTNKTNDDEKR